jgi:LysR family transcriptional regulator of gallate degradation
MLDDVVTDLDAAAGRFPGLRALVEATAPTPEPVHRTEPRRAAPPESPALSPQGPELNMRRLRALVAVAQCRSVNRAAERLHLTQSAVTRAVRALEAEWGVTLFERTPRAMVPTAFGERLVERASRSLGYLEAAERRLGSDGSKGLVGKVSQRHLQAVSTIADFQTETAAARQLGISQPAVNLALRDLEALLGVQLFVRNPKGMVPTLEGEVIIRGAKLVLSEMAAGVADLAAQLGQVRGRLTVGALPLTGAHIAPRAVMRLARQHPDLRLTVLEAPYDVLLKGLRCGDIDVLVGALHPRMPSDVDQEHLFDDQLAVVARAGHPLAARRTVAIEDLQACEWVLPFRRARARNMVEAAMLAAGLAVPERALEAGSVALVRSLLLESDCLSVLLHFQIEHERRQGLLQVLPVSLPAARLPIGLMTRADAMQTEGLKALLEALRSLCSERHLPPSPGSG